MVLRKFFLTIFVYFILTGCSDNKKYGGELPFIDVKNSIGKYQTALCSDFFSSAELVQLETNDECLIGSDPVVLLKDSLIFVCSVSSFRQFPPVSNIHVFDRMGRFLNQIGVMGRGPGEIAGILEFFLDSEKSIIYIADFVNIFEYEFTGKFIRSFPRPKIEGHAISNVSYVGDNLFIGAVSYSQRSSCKYYLFNRDGVVIKCFPSRCMYNIDKPPGNAWDLSVAPFRVENNLYVKDYVNDTLYILANLNLKPAYIFDFEQYSYSLGGIDERGQIEIIPVDGADANNRYMRILSIVGTPKYFFYSITIPSMLPRPKARPIFLRGREVPDDTRVHGIYNIAKNTNLLLDTDQQLQKGFINDVNGGLSFFPRYYAGDDVVVDIWQAEDMKEILTEEYFSSLEIKDQEAHQKLRELLKNLEEEDNPVVVLAKLK